MNVFVRRPTHLPHGRVFPLVGEGSACAAGISPLSLPHVEFRVGSDARVPLCRSVRQPVSLVSEGDTRTGRMEKDGDELDLGVNAVEAVFVELS